MALSSGFEESSEWLQVGISLVGLSSLLSGEGSAQVIVSQAEMLLGMGLIVASQVRCWLLLPPPPCTPHARISCHLAL